MSDQDKSPDWVAGYQARCREEVETYLRIVDAGHQVYDRVIRGLVNTPTFAEREEARLAVLAEAHAAELHVGRPVLDRPGRAGCPVCMEAYAAVVGPGRCYARGHVQGHLGPFRGGCDVWLPNGNNAVECPDERSIVCDCGHSADRHFAYGCLVPDNVGGSCICQRPVWDLTNRGPDLTARCPVCDAGPYATPAWLRGHLDEAHPEIRGGVPAHNGHYGAPQWDVDDVACPGCGGEVTAHGLHKSTGLTRCADNAPKSDYGVSPAGPLCSHGYIADGQACPHGCPEPSAGGTSLTRCETCGAPSLLCEHAPDRAGGAPWPTGTTCQGDAGHPPHPAGTAPGCEGCDETVNPPVEGSELAASDRKICACGQADGLARGEVCPVCGGTTRADEVVTTLQPPPCKRHAGEGNQLNCPDCGRRRQDHYARLGG